MNTSELATPITPPHKQATQAPNAQPASLGLDSILAELAWIIGRSPRFKGDQDSLNPGERAALARLDPDGELRPRQVAALTRVLLDAGLAPEDFSPTLWRAWTLIAHGIALTGHSKEHPLGQQLAEARVAESRVTRLLTARGDAFRQLLPRLLRLLAAGGVAPNWLELGRLILLQEQEGRSNRDVEALRLQIASRYFSTLASLTKKTST